MDWKNSDEAGSSVGNNERNPLYEDKDLPRERMTGVFPIDYHTAAGISTRRKLDRIEKRLYEIGLILILGVNFLIVAILLA